MQLVAYGAQDVYLTGNPQITFMKVVYRRHTNFAMESIECGFSGEGDFGKKVTATISRNGDLIHKVYLRAKLPAVTVAQNKGFRWLNWVGHVLIKSVEVEIGGQRIDKHYGDWLHIWNELTQTAGHQLGYANMVGNHPSLTNPRLVTSSTAQTVPETMLYIPLEFWFNRNPGLALPLIALQYHEVKINIELNEFKNCCWMGTYDVATTTWSDDASFTAIPKQSLSQVALLVDYIYLDTDERRRFAQSAHEYLVEQLQFTGDEAATSANPRARLNFNHPVKELVWVIQRGDFIDDSAIASQTTRVFGKQWFNYTDDYDKSYNASFTLNTDPNPAVYEGANVGGMPGVAAGGANGVFVATSFEGGAGPLVKAKIQLNGHDRMAERDGRYFNLVQPYQHHENVPKNGIYVYSFALKPEEHQPSGTCNMSRIDNAMINMEITPNSVSPSTRIRVYAVNYNVLRIMSGMGGLAYSN